MYIVAFLALRVFDVVALVYFARRGDACDTATSTRTHGRHYFVLFSIVILKTLRPACGCVWFGPSYCA